MSYTPTWMSLNNACRNEWVAIVYFDKRKKTKSKLKHISTQSGAKKKVERNLKAKASSQRHSFWEGKYFHSQSLCVTEKNYSHLPRYGRLLSYLLQTLFKGNACYHFLLQTPHTLSLSFSCILFQTDAVSFILWATA